MPGPSSHRRQPTATGASGPTPLAARNGSTPISVTGAPASQSSHRRRRVRRRLSLRPRHAGRRGRSASAIPTTGCPATAPAAARPAPISASTARRAGAASTSTQRSPTAASTAMPRALDHRHRHDRDRASRRRPPTSSPAASSSAGRSMSASTTGGQVALTPFARPPARATLDAGLPRTARRRPAGRACSGSPTSRARPRCRRSWARRSTPQTEIGGRPLNAWVRAAWVHEFLTDRSVTAGFHVLPGTSFTVDGARAASDAARIDMGVNYDAGQPDLAVRQRHRRTLRPRPEPRRHGRARFVW